MDHLQPRFLRLAAELRTRKLLGPGDCPLKEVMLASAPGGSFASSAIDLVPHAGADEGLLREAVDFCEGWDWGGRRGPDVRLAKPWRKPDRVIDPRA